MSVASLSYGARVHDRVERSHVKGRILSHLLGAVLASEFLIGGAAGRKIPFVNIPMFTQWLDFPLRLIVLWLILDRTWRVGRLRVGMWDALVLGFVGIVGVLFPYTALDPSVSANFESYRGFAGDMIRFYTIYLLVREGYNRAGFNGRTMLYWLLGALAFSAVLALLQAFDVGSARLKSMQFYNQIHNTVQFLNPNEPYRSPGTATHWNGFASTMILAAIIVLSPLHWRRLRWYEIALAALYVIALGASTSRGGYITLAVTGFAAGVFFLWTGRRKTGLVLLGTMSAFVAMFAVLVVSLEVPRFKELFNPPKVETSDLGSWRYRMERSRRLTEVGIQHPVIGTGPSDRLYENTRIMYKSASSVEGVLDVTYPVLFAQFGFIGLLYMGGVMLFFLRFIGRNKAVHPYAAMAFLTGVAFATHSTVENLMRSQLMVVVSVVAGIAASRVLANAFELRRSEPKPAPHAFLLPRA